MSAERKRAHEGLDVTVINRLSARLTVRARVCRRILQTDI
jgi:hypothetical protein